MKAQLPEEAVTQLLSIFPDHSPAYLQACLTKHDFNVEISVASLLADPDESPIKVPRQMPADFLRGNARAGSGRGGRCKFKGWHALTKASANPGSAQPAADQPFKSGTSATAEWPRVDDSGEFPSLHGNHKSADAAAQNAQPATATANWRRQLPSVQDESEALRGDFARVLGRHGRSTNAAAGPVQCSGSPAERDSHQECQQQHRRQKQEAMEAQLLAAHPWAGRELVQAVVTGVGGDARAAGACLDEMLAAHLQQRRRSSDMSGSGRLPSSGHLLGAAATGARADGAAAAAEPHSSFSLAEPPDEHKLAADLAEEPYRHHRGEAIRLTHGWQRGMHRAAAAFAAGDKGAAHDLARGARQKREEALAAHAAAARSIMRENNAQRYEFELDLHGLHALEATAALQERLRDLETRGGTAAGGGGGNAQRLRVIVGRGRHSSAGEAILPRAVESWLLEQGRKFTPYGGAIEVHLRQGSRRSSAK